MISITNQTKGFQLKLKLKFLFKNHIKHFSLLKDKSKYES